MGFTLAKISYRQPQNLRRQGRSARLSHDALKGSRHQSHHNHTRHHLVNLTNLTQAHTAVHHSTIFRMALKRKRSSAPLSSPASIASSATTNSASPPPFTHHNQAIHTPTWSFPTYDDQPQQNLNSRTRKRYRNNRPSEQFVEGVSCWLGAVMEMSSLADVCRCAASTIAKLFAAQKQLTSQPTTTTTPPPEPEQLPPQRTTLHSFWRIPQPPPMTLAGICGQETDKSRCENCEQLSRHDDDNAMDIDEIFGSKDMACQSCQRVLLAVR